MSITEFDQDMMKLDELISKGEEDSLDSVYEPIIRKRPKGATVGKSFISMGELISPLFGSRIFPIPTSRANMLPIVSCNFLGSIA